MIGVGSMVQIISDDSFEGLCGIVQEVNEDDDVLVMLAIRWGTVSKEVRITEMRFGRQELEVVDVTL